MAVPGCINIQYLKITICVNIELNIPSYNEVESFSSSDKENEKKKLVDIFQTYSEHTSYSKMGYAHIKTTAAIKSMLNLTNTRLCLYAISSVYL